MHSRFLWLVSSLAAAACLFHTTARAEDASPVAMVEVSCKSSKAASPEELQNALQSVKSALLEKYLASVMPERKTALSEKKSIMLAQPDFCLNNFLVRNQEFDKKTKILTLSAQADINTAYIDKLIGGSAEKVEHHQMVFIFAARRQSEVKSEGPKVTTATQRTGGNQSEAEGSSRNGVVSASETKKTTEMISTASSETRTADHITYIVENNNKADIDAAISGVLVNRGFDVASAADLVAASNGQFNPDEFEKDFETSSQFSMKHQSIATRVCREAGAPLLAYGTLTIGVKRTDPVNSRNTLVAVKIDAQILDCRKPLASKVGSIGALQVEGVGADQTQAETEAIKLAAEKAATTLADQLNNRGIH